MALVVHISGLREAGERRAATQAKKAPGKAGLACSLLWLRGQVKDIWKLNKSTCKHSNFRMKITGLKNDADRVNWHEILCSVVSSVSTLQTKLATGQFSLAVLDASKLQCVGVLGNSRPFE